ncbi:MAG: hypothetical protein KF836_07485 [Fimbriimonadaceae bacterium]|nr:hypothetical protein [Fimbriimonadaceae bacterium]
MAVILLTCQPATPRVRAHHDLVYDEASKNILLFGGSTPLEDGKSFEFYNELWRLNGERWNLVGNIGKPISSFRLAYDKHKRKVFSYGGYTSAGEVVGDFRVLEGNQWRTITANPEMAAAEPGFVYDSKRKILVAFGGSANGKSNTATWEWSGEKWEKVSCSPPTVRGSFVMVFDEKAQRTILVTTSGEADSRMTTWAYDGKTWSTVDSQGPEKRVAASSAYDSRRGVIILFGGFGSAGVFADTWEWNGKSWRRVAENGPRARGMGYMAYDSHRDRTVMFGGRYSWPNDANDTWEWDGKSWMQILPHE